MAKNEFKSKSSEQLAKEVSDMREKLRTIRFGGAGSRSRNVKESRSIRKDIARALTAMRTQKISIARAEIAEKAKKA